MRLKHLRCRLNMHATPSIEEGSRAADEELVEGAAEGVGVPRRRASDPQTAALVSAADLHDLQTALQTARWSAGSAAIT
jgi:hypothetical protein